ncbi:hypothetical protein D3C73_1107860 [compost metagenome]
MPTLTGHIFVAEILGQAITQAAISGEQIEHGMYPRNLGLLMPSEAGVQLCTQLGTVEIGLQQAVDLGHQLAFKLDPALFLEIIQRLDHPTALGLMLLVQRIEIHRGPGTRARGRLDDRRDEIPAFTLEARQQLLGLLQILEPVFGVVGITRSDQTTKLQLNQQGLERQLADVALVRQWPQQKLPLSLGRGGLHLVEHAADTVQFRRVAIDEVFQHVEAVAVGQHQAVRWQPVTPGTADFLAVVFDRFG